MKKALLQRNSIYLFALIFFLGSCGDPKSEKRDALPTSSPTNSPSPPANSNALANQVTTSARGFSVSNICSLPKEVAGNSPFADLGGGTWGKWGDSEGELDYGCNGGNDSAKLEKEIAKVSAAYGALGRVDTVRFVFVKYTALQYGGKTPVEERLRHQYFDFCDNLSDKFFGQKLPEKFKKRLTDDSTYSSQGAANEYHEKAGTGYVNLKASKNTTAMVTLELRFFASEAEYKKYKDS